MTQGDSDNHREIALPRRWQLTPWPRPTLSTSRPATALEFRCFHGQSIDGLSTITPLVAWYSNTLVKCPNPISETLFPLPSKLHCPALSMTSPTNLQASLYTSPTRRSIRGSRHGCSDVYKDLLRWEVRESKVGGRVGKGVVLFGEVGTGGLGGGLQLWRGVSPFQMRIGVYGRGRRRILRDGRGWRLKAISCPADLSNVIFSLVNSERG